MADVDRRDQPKTTRKGAKVSDTDYMQFTEPDLMRKLNRMSRCGDADPASPPSTPSADCSRCEETKEKAMSIYETFKRDSANYRRRIDDLERAIRGYQRAKGRHNTQKACEALIALLPENANSGGSNQ